MPIQNLSKFQRNSLSYFKKITEQNLIANTIKIVSHRNALPLTQIITCETRVRL